MSVILIIYNNMAKKQDIQIGQVWTKSKGKGLELPYIIVVQAISAKMELVIHCGMEYTFDFLLNNYELNKNYQ